MPLRASRELGTKLEAVSNARCPFSEIPRRKAGASWHSSGMTEEDVARTIWVTPRYRAEVSFLEWTKGGFLRHAKVKRALAGHDR
jgi:hypothetical protein